MSEIESELLTVKQTCQLLNISRTLLYSRSSSEVFGIVPIRIGRKVLFSRKELLAHIDAGMPPRTKWQTMKKLKHY